jgi:hypothetical protein
MGVGIAVAHWAHIVSYHITLMSKCWTGLALLAHIPLNDE